MNGNMSKCFQGSINLADYIGWESSFNLDRESHTLALVFKYDHDHDHDVDVVTLALVVKYDHVHIQLPHLSIK